MTSPAEDPPRDEAVPLPITGELDLHTFRPAEVGDLLEDYLAACAERGIDSVRIVHGKGTGALRERVHAWLRRSPLVVSFALCNAAEGGWGATRARLRPSKNAEARGAPAAGPKA